MPKYLLTDTTEWTRIIEAVSAFASLGGVSSEGNQNPSHTTINCRMGASTNPPGQLHYHQPVGTGQRKPFSSFPRRHRVIKEDLNAFSYSKFKIQEFSDGRRIRKCRREWLLKGPSGPSLNSSHVSGEANSSHWHLYLEWARREEKPTSEGWRSLTYPYINHFRVRLSQCIFCSAL